MDYRVPFRLEVSKKIQVDHIVSLHSRQLESFMEINWICHFCKIYLCKGWIIMHILPWFLLPSCFYSPQSVIGAMVLIMVVAVPKAAILGLFQLQCSRNTCCLAVSAPLCPSSAMFLNVLSSLKIKLHLIINILPHIHKNWKRTNSKKSYEYIKILYYGYTTSNSGAHSHLTILNKPGLTRPHRENPNVGPCLMTFFNLCLLF